MSKKNLWKDYIEPVSQEENEDGEPNGKEEISTSEDSQTLSDEKNDFKKVPFDMNCIYILPNACRREGSWDLVCYFACYCLHF